MASNLNYEFGFSAQGIEDLLAEVKGCVIRDAAGHARSNVADIKTACGKIWDGQSKEDFINQLTTDANQFASALEGLYSAFEKEIANAGFDFNRFDQNLFK